MPKQRECILDCKILFYLKSVATVVNIRNKLEGVIVPLLEGLQKNSFSKENWSVSFYVVYQMIFIK
jgi:hypothetical protein